jgi:hypothetical protein
LPSCFLVRSGFSFLECILSTDTLLVSFSSFTQVSVPLKIVS